MYDILEKMSIERSDAFFSHALQSLNERYGDGFAEMHPEAAIKLSILYALSAISVTAGIK
jgi:hypothetical protein